MSDYDFTFDLSMTYTQADFDAITDEEFEKTTEVFLYNRKGEEFHFIKPKVGRWIDTNMTCCGAKVYKCSVCDNEIDEMPTEEGEPIWNYCPNCGVKMKRRADGDI